MVRGMSKNGFRKISFKTRSKMAKFRPIKKLGTVLERWEDEKTGKKTKDGMANPKKDKKEKKDPFKEEKKGKKEKEKGLF